MGALSCLPQTCRLRCLFSIGTLLAFLLSKYSYQMYSALKIQVRAAHVAAGMCVAERWNKSSIIFLLFFVLLDKPARNMKVLPRVFCSQPNIMF